MVQYCLCCDIFIDNAFALTVSHACLFDIINKDVKGIITVTMTSKVTQRDCQHSETGNTKNISEALISQFSRQTERFLKYNVQHCM